MKKAPTKLKRKIKPTKAILRAKDIKKPGKKMPLGKPGNIKRVKKTSPAKKPLVGKQANLPKELRDKILASPAKMLKPAALKMMKKSPSKMMKKK